MVYPKWEIEQFIQCLPLRCLGVACENLVASCFGGSHVSWKQPALGPCFPRLSGGMKTSSVVALCGSRPTEYPSPTPLNSLKKKNRGECAVCWLRWRLSWQRLQRLVSNTRSWQRTLDERSKNDPEAVGRCTYIYDSIIIYGSYSSMSLSNMTLDFRVQIIETRSTITIMLQHRGQFLLHVDVRDGQDPLLPAPSVYAESWTSCQKLDLAKKNRDFPHRRGQGGWEVVV